MRRAASNVISFERWKISSFTRKVGNDALKTCLKVTRSSASKASLSQVPDAIKLDSRADRVVRIRGLFMCHSKRPNVAAADLPFREFLFVQFVREHGGHGGKGADPTCKVGPMHVHSSCRRLSGPSPRAEVTTYRGGCRKTAPARPSDA